MARTEEKQTLYRNKDGQIRCHRCLGHSHVIYPVHLRNQNGSWVSMLCYGCRNGPPGSRVIQVDDPIDTKTYAGPIKDDYR